MLASSVSEAGVALSVRGVSKAFAGTPVLQDISFDVHSGEFHALLGENGAGKSTLIKIISGVHEADTGTILRSTAVEQHGVSFVHQDLALVGPMTVAENIGHVLGFSSHRGLISWRETRRRAQAALDAVGLELSPDVIVSRLSRGEQTMVAIARAVAVEAGVIVLDEPTATLTVSDVDRLFDLLQTVKSAGCGILYVTHRLDEVFRVADAVTVLRDGRRVSTRSVAASSLAGVSQDIIGRELSAIFPSRGKGQPSRNSFFALRSLECREPTSERFVGPIDLAVSRGEVVGLVGLRGAGQELVGRSVRDPGVRVGGQVVIGGRIVEGEPTRDGLVAVVPAERKAEGIFEGLDLRENLYPTGQGSTRRRARFVRPRTERAAARDLLVAYHVTPGEPDRRVETLSGGNQQKVVLARAISGGCPVVILEEPTAGVDIGARAEIYRLVRAAADGGRAVLVISSDFEEVAGLCDTIHVCRGGRIVGSLEGGVPTRDHLAALAIGSEVA